MLGHDPLGEHVEDERDIDPAGPRSDVGEIGDSGVIRHRSGGLAVQQVPGADDVLAGFVVRIAFARVIPDRLRTRPTPGPRHYGTRLTTRCDGSISAVIFFRPYRPSGVILRRSTPDASTMIVHAASRTAFTTIASVTVRTVIRRTGSCVPRSPSPTRAGPERSTRRRSPPNASGR